MESLIQFLMVVLIFGGLHQASAQSFVECCDLNLLDATRQVAIETDRILQIGTFQAARVRLCTMDPVLIQIWTRNSASQFQLKWQYQITPTDQQANEIYSIINLQNNPVTLAADDRLAVYSPSNTSSKVPVPYDINSINGALYYSQSRYTGSQFSNGQQINLDTLKWPRTFSAYITFCENVNNCSPAVGSSTTPRSTTRSQTGPPGICCPAPPAGQISCDPGGVIKNGLGDQENQIRALEDDIKRLLFILNNLLNSTVVTGICPDGFISGVYGVGSCYVIHKDEQVQLAQAAIRCRDLYKAELLRLETALEDQFIKNAILNRTNPAAIEKFWTAGMYNIPLRNWYWYSDSTRTKAPLTYRNWEGGMEPAATSIYDVCSVLVVESASSLDYWQKNECTLANYYICEIPKKCL